MVKCHIHPDRDAPYVCQKVNIRGYCPECIQEGVPCFDPEIYCKYRGQCVIWSMAREAGLHRKSDNGEENEKAAASGTG
jgi:hypothetical protein